ncbi:hypothetical protein JVT61DRAFT_10819 [Boletus reticuloceps]|uniref:Uncharacterized protein n=1 Tax=Boletus reticuloceps TaxID=495285 RepID=A0A8I2YF54_9AGAM|nr:hypothetical protein JVT61DRAFT_10819 [Boletus reticuloceps]
MDPLAHHSASEKTSILVDFEIKTFTPYIIYPSLHDFLEKLDSTEPHHGWLKLFLMPLTRMGVQHLDDIDLVTPECLYVFHRLPPIVIMDLLACIHETIQTIHQTRPLVEAKNHVNFVGYVHGLA